VGETLAVETTASGPPAVGAPVEDGMGDLVQGALETSNVNVVQELVEMIEAQRAYEINSRSISASDEMMSYLANQL
jgi:flagellar basal-body rod protein FlgG